MGEHLSIFAEGILFSTFLLVFIIGYSVFYVSLKLRSPEEAEKSPRCGACWKELKGDNCEYCGWTQPRAEMDRDNS